MVWAELYRSPMGLSCVCPEPAGVLAEAAGGFSPPLPG